MTGCTTIRTRIRRARLSVSDDGLFLVDSRGPVSPFQWSYRIRPREGNMVIFPATVPHGVHSTMGTEPRVPISRNHPGDWQRFTNSKTVFQESTWTHDMMSREGVASARKLAKEKKSREMPTKEKKKQGWCL